MDKSFYVSPNNELTSLLEYITDLEREYGAPKEHRQTSGGTAAPHEDEEIAFVAPPHILILRATLFLVTYGLIEVTVRECFDLTHTEINRGNYALSQIVPALRTTWINQEVFDSIIHVDASPRDYQERLHTISETSSNEDRFTKFTRRPHFRGNLDALVIRRVMEQYGAPVPSVSNETQKALRIIRKQRNDLTHGNITFQDCGRQYSLSEISNYIEGTREYLEEFMECIAKYLSEQLYLAKKRSQKG